MTAVHIQRAGDAAVGEAIRRLQGELTPVTDARIELLSNGLTRVQVMSAYDRRPLVTETGTDLEDVCDAVLGVLAARKVDPIVTVEGQWPDMYFVHCRECNLNVAAKDEKDDAHLAAARHLARKHSGLMEAAADEPAAEQRYPVPGLTYHDLMCQPWGHDPFCRLASPVDRQDEQ